MKKLFGNINISWKFLILFSCIIGILVGIFNRIPFLNNTSFQDIAIFLEMWIILAIFIIVNCKSSKEAVVKCFLFFLISQPLIYFTEILIDVFINNSNFSEKFILYFRNYYIGGGWLLATFLTIPGSYIAYKIKKENILSSIILSVATIYLSFIGANGLLTTLLDKFPYHLLNGLICLIMSFALIFLILKNKKERIISIVITIIGVILGIVYYFYNSNQMNYSNYIMDFDSNTSIVEYYIDNENIVSVELEDTFANFIAVNVGSTKVTLEDSNGNKYIYDVNVTNNSTIVTLNR